MHIKKDDIVVVLNGVKAEDKKKTGKVLRVDTAKNRVFVEGLNMRKKHYKPQNQNEQAAILDIEGSIHVSNVALYCPTCKKGVRTGSKVLADGKKVRYCKKCNTVLDK